MTREFFMKTQRLGFSVWTGEDSALAESLWGDPAVSRFICASGRFSAEEIAARLNKEIEQYEQHRVQYWPVFSLQSGEFIGCCGLRPYREGEYELGFHLRPQFWGQSYAREAAQAVIRYAFDVLHAGGLFAGHHPWNAASARVLGKLGFCYVGARFYPPTGLDHPSYELRKKAQ